MDVKYHIIIEQTILLLPYSIQQEHNRTRKPVPRPHNPAPIQHNPVQHLPVLKQLAQPIKQPGLLLVNRLLHIPIKELTKILVIRFQFNSF